MNKEQLEIFQGKKIKILEMNLLSVDNKVELTWEIYFENTICKMKFYNVSRLMIENLSPPLEIHGFKIIDYFQNNWEMDSRYEINDFEDNCVNFFCESIERETRNVLNN